MQSKVFLNILKKNNIEFFTGVPDSLMKNFIRYIDSNIPKNKHFVTANEGSAIGISIGYHLSTNKVPLIYLQNSGLGNCINPLTSLADPKVYSIPMVLLIGWRGEKNISDEPQHIKQGEITDKILEVLGIPYVILNRNTHSFEISNLIKFSKKNSCAVAFLVRKNFFDDEVTKKNKKIKYSCSREDVIKQVVSLTNKKDIIVSTTGMLSRELYELRKKNKDNVADFYTVGGMGHASQIAFGLALSNKSKKVICLDGDGAAIMHMGGLVTIGTQKPNNFRHLIINNGVHGSVGDQNTNAMKINFKKIAMGCGYTYVSSIFDKKNLKKNIKSFLFSNSCSFLEVKVNTEFRADLGRPDKSPIQNKEKIMKLLNRK